MARGPSGRVVIEVEPSLKRALHAQLVSEGRSLKEWFLECAESYLDPPQQSLPLQLGEASSPTYGEKKLLDGGSGPKRAGRGRVR